MTTATKTAKKTGRVDLYQKVTDEIIEHLENGIRPWSRSWIPSGITLPTRATGESYRGINVLILWAAQMKHGFRCNVWMTFKQAGALGAAVRKGEKGQFVVFYSAMERENNKTDGADGSDKAVRIPYLKQYTVFNLEQIENLPADYALKISSDTETPEGNSTDAVHNAADAVLYATDADIVHGGDRAFYHPGTDQITMPTFSAFRDADAYTATLAHELIHWTAPAHRVGRDLRTDAGVRDIAREELVAEIGAAFVCAGLSVAAKERQDHADYIGSWLKLLRNDKRAILRAAAKAQLAADYLLQTQPPEAIHPR